MRSSHVEINSEVLCWRLPVRLLSRSRHLPASSRGRLLHSHTCTAQVGTWRHVPVSAVAAMIAAAAPNTTTSLIPLFLSREGTLPRAIKV